MRSSFNFEWAHRMVHFGLLRAASLLVPGPQRAEWWREWRGELWHVRHSRATAGVVSRRGEREVTAFCLGAFQDALCLRRAGRQTTPLFAAMEGTPRLCILILGAALAASYAIALLLPGVRAERSLWPRKVNPNLVLIQQEGSSDGSWPTISPRLFRSWEGRNQKYFDGFAFYGVTREPVETGMLFSGTVAKSAWGVARASSNLFTLLGLPVEFADGGVVAGGVPAVILSEKVWKRDFGADEHLAGLEVRLGQRMVRIAGVAPDGSLGLPGRVDAWELEPDADTEAGGAGYVVAHLTAVGKAEMWTQCVHITAIGPDDSEEDFLGISLEEWKPATITIYLFSLFLALLALPAITSVSLGEYSVNPQPTSWSRKLYRWSFLSAKIALLLPINYFVSMDLAYGCTTFGGEQSVYVQLASTFAMCLFGLRWVLKDQRQRCPVCVCRVAHPAQVGQASRTFLDWNGTEMMCMGGHTLLHVPSLPTSWFGAQRWLYLDTSWNFLFAGSTRPIP
ncbi:MAG: hypothetical protein ABR987_11710 [Terracidiphilus sp.]|jgi:hypothetical protein